MASEVEELATKSAGEIGRAIGRGEADPRALTELYLERAEAQPEVFAHVTAKRARREAAAAYERAKAGFRRGPLDGAPISWKDLVDVAGAPTMAGSRLLEGRIADADAQLVRRAGQAGLVCLGKTHLSELAFSGLGYNPMTATPKNRYDETVAPGGSSSGAAASIAFGSAAAAIGSDTGGSVRIPAAWNGLVGLKTSHGALPMAGVTPLAPALDTIGPLARTVEDCALLWAALGGGLAPAAGPEPRRLRFLVAETAVLDDVEPSRRAAFDAAVERLKLAGAHCVRGAVPEFEQALAVIAEHGGVVNTQGYAIWRELIEAAPDKMYARILERFRSGAGFRSDQTEYVHLEMGLLAKTLAARISGYDAVLAPTTPNDPPKLARLAADAEHYASENLRALRNTRLANLLKLCSLTLPTPAVDGAFPGALMLSAPAGRETLLLRAGLTLERVLGSVAR